MSTFNQANWNEKIDSFKKAMEQISESVAETTEKLEKVEDTWKEQAPSVDISKVKKPQDHLPKEEKNNLKPKFNDFYSGYEHETPTFVGSADTTYNYTWPTATWNFKQSYGTPPNPWQPAGHWNPSYETDEEYIQNLVLTITVINTDTIHNSTFLNGTTGKVGACWVFSEGSYSYKHLPKTFVWSEANYSWIEVPYQDVVDFWNSKKSSSYDNLYAIKEKSIPVVHTTPNAKQPEIPSTSVSFGFDPASENVSVFKNAKIKFTPLPDEPKQESLAKQVTFVIYQKTKPKVKQEGKLWINTNTDTWFICINNEWIPFLSVDQIEYYALNDAGYFKKDKKVEPKTKLIGSGLHFRGNCGKWHEIIEPENTVFKSVNGKYEWFYSTKPAAEEYNCGHDFKRIMPVFSTEEMDNKIKEIKANQAGNNDTIYYVNLGKNNKSNWDQVHSKQTIMVGGRPFHHNSGNHIWYMCLTKSEYLVLDTYGTVKQDVIDDGKNIFLGAIPVYSNKSASLSWYLDGTSNVMAKNSNDQNDPDDILYSVQILADQAEYAKAKKKTVPSEFKQPTAGSSYFIGDQETMNSYLAWLKCAHEGNYSIEQLKNKAIKAHQYLMHDLALAALKKSKKNYTFLIQCLEDLQEAYQIAEEWHISSNVPYGYLKPITPVNGTFRYLSTTTYGIPE